MLSLKVVAVGDSKVGKRSLLRSYTEGVFPTDNIKDVSSGCATEIEICDKHIRLVLWDTESDEKYARLRPLTYPLTDVFLLCFSVSDHKSFQNIENIWYPEIIQTCPDVPCVLVGTKSDTKTNEETSKSQIITDNEANSLAKRIKAFKYIECSALTREGLDEVFTEAVFAVLDVCPKTDALEEEKTDEKADNKECILS